MKIAIIGNSHVACLKQAWDNELCNEYKSIDLVFFASEGSTIRSLKAVNGRLISNSSKVRKNMKLSSGGADSIMPDDFGLFVLHGLSPRSIENWSTMESYSGDIFYSRKVLKISSPLYKCAAFKITHQIRKISDLPVIISPRPNEVIEDLAQEVTDDEYTYFQRLIHEIHDDRGVIFYPQPQSTICKKLYTKEEFSVGAKRLVRGGNEDGRGVFPEDDKWHMNEVYGREYIVHLFHLIEQHNMKR